MPDIIELANVLRNNRIESKHYGIVCHANRDGLVESWGDINFNCYTRSIIKPIQAKVALDILGESLCDELLAIAIASHRAEPQQLEQVKNLMDKFAVLESELLCDCMRNGKQYYDSPISHNCSGKHAALIAACKQQGWSVDNYSDPQHPIQTLIMQELQDLLGSNIDIEVAVDGCGLPTYYMSLLDMAMLLVNLLSRDDYRDVIDVMRSYPYLIGGSEMIDSIVMDTSSNLIAKGGAEGLMAIANIDKQEAVIIKVIDGSHRAKAVVTVAWLEQLGWLDAKGIKTDSSILCCL